MIIPYRFASAAEEELAKSILFYKDISPELADDFVRQLDRVIDSFEDRPILGLPPMAAYVSFHSLAFRLLSTIASSRKRSSFTPLHTKAAAPDIGSHASRK